MYKKYQNLLKIYVCQDIVNLIIIFIKEIEIGDQYNLLKQYLKIYKKKHQLILNSNILNDSKQFWQYVSKKISEESELKKKKKQKINLCFLKVFQNQLDWQILSKYYLFPIQSLDNFSNLIQWDKLIENQIITPKIFYKYENYFQNYMYNLPIDLGEKLGENFFIEKNQYFFSQAVLTSIAIKSSLQFIEKFQNQISWHYISLLRNYDEKFVILFCDKLHYDCVLLQNNQNKITNKFLTQFIEYFDTFVFLNYIYCLQHLKIFHDENNTQKNGMQLYHKIFNILQRLQNILKICHYSKISKLISKDTNWKLITHFCHKIFDFNCQKITIQ